MMKRMLRILEVIMCILILENTCFFIPSKAAVQDDKAILLSADNLMSVTDGTVKNEEYVEWSKEDESAVWEFEVAEDGSYRMGFEYEPLPGRVNDVEIALKIDGAYPGAAMESVVLPRMWENAGEIRKDSMGNEFSPEQKEFKGRHTWWAKDRNGLTKGDISVELAAGRHKLEIISGSEPFKLYHMTVSQVPDIKPYKELEKSYGNYIDYTGEPIIIQGENAVRKTSKSLTPMSDKTTAMVTPSDPFVALINYIGANNWNQPNDELVWETHVKQSGLYALHINYDQSYLLNATSYRTLRIDGEIPFLEAENLAFSYSSNWKREVFSNKDKPYLFYLEEGEHEISLSVTLGPMSDIISELNKTVFKIGDMYRQINMITGDVPDPGRDYNLFGQIPNMEQELSGYKATLELLSDKLKAMSSKKGNTNAATLDNMAGVIDRMLRYKFQAQQYKGDFYNNYCGISAALYEMKSMPLGIDEIVFAAPQNNKVKKVSAAERFVFSIKRFFASFASDYAVRHEDEGETLTVWANWGRDQAQALDYLIRSSFTPQYNISVNLEVMNASVIQAILSGNGPDCALQLSRTEPVNLAMRSAVYNLESFDDWNEVTGRFMESAAEPYRYKNGAVQGTYALPDTQQFYMMFYRKDIFDELGITLPKTWDEFLDVSAVIQQNNMQVGLPYTQITDIGQINAGVGALSFFPTLLMQRGESLYSSKLDKINLLSETSVETFNFWTDFYTKYRFPVSFDFYNRFRIGMMPLGIVTYSTYSTFSVAAPEIEGLWDIAPIPGIPGEDGTVNNAQAGGGTGSVILNISKNKSGAWKFLKWWTSAETQARYSNNIESVLGVAARHPTSNVEAFSQLPWKSGSRKVLLEQWEQVREVPEIPGGYFTARAIDQAYWNVVNNGMSTKDMLVKWSREVDEEIKSKRIEYDIRP